MSFKDYIVEMAARKPEPTPLRQVSEKELVPLLGKGRLNSVMKNPLWQEISGYEKAYQYEVDKNGFVYLQAYAFMRSVHTMPDGKIRPQFMIRFRFTYTGTSVADATKYFRPMEPSELEKKYGPSAGWTHAKDWSKFKD